MVTQELQRGPTVGDVMTPAPFTIDRDASLAEAHELMRKLHVRHLPVMSAGRLVGVLSERDALVAESIIGPADDDKVIDAMTSTVYTTTTHAQLRDVARVMAAEKYGCAVVMDGSRVRGIFTATDALRYLVATLP